MIDVAGLVRDAHKGRGLGNKFLDDLRQANTLIHIVDASGGTDAEGNICKPGEHDPLEDVDFLEGEVDHWIAGILKKDWNKMTRMSKMDGEKIERLMQSRLAGLGINEVQVISALKETGNPEDTGDWTDEQLLDFAARLRSVSKPMLIAANKADLAPKENLEKLGEHDAVPTSAEMELALRRAAKSGLIKYEIGGKEFEILDEKSLSGAQSGALEKIGNYLKEFGGTGVQKCIEHAVYDLLDMIAVYPVEDETKLTDKEGRVLPDAYLMKKGSNARDLAYKVHTDLGENFIKAVNVRSKRVVAQDYELQDCDIITIYSR
jgi:ribosome-binding ATPase YchF (GTP1/OBG family)